MENKMILASEKLRPVDPVNDMVINFYAQKLQLLETKLDQFNLLEHPVQIQQLCREIRAVKNKLEQLKLRRNNLLSN